LASAQHQYSVTQFPDFPSLPCHAIVTASLRASNRRSVAVQVTGCLVHSGETFIQDCGNALQLIVSVKDRFGNSSCRHHDVMVWLFHVDCDSNFYMTDPGVLWNRSHWKTVILYWRIFSIQKLQMWVWKDEPSFWCLHGNAYLYI
jgi:hypothetical protein